MEHGEYRRPPTDAECRAAWAGVLERRRLIAQARARGVPMPWDADLTTSLTDAEKAEMEQTA